MALALLLARNRYFTFNLESIAMRHLITFSAALSVLAFGCAAAEEPAISDDSAELNAVISCEREILLACDDGQFDGCLEPGLTTAHVCVANEDRKASTACALEILHQCDEGLIDACAAPQSVSDKHICIKASGSQGSSGGSGSSSPKSCALELLLACDEGSFDGCLVNGLTENHVCVANEDREGKQQSCALETLRVCDEGFQDACIVEGAPAATHICVATK